MKIYKNVKLSLIVPEENLKINLWILPTTNKQLQCPTSFETSNNLLIIPTQNPKLNPSKPDEKHATSLLLYDTMPCLALPH